MRAILLSILVTIALAVSGCLGGGDDVENGAASDVTAVPALEATISSPGLGLWLEPGESLDVSASAPAEAVGNVTYTWAIQQDPVTLFDESETVDTGNITPGASASLTFDTPALYEAGHCDPHPWMKHTVAVLDGYDSPEEVTVFIVEADPADTDTWVFVPQHITVGTGTTVTYQNLGQNAHTASLAHKGEVIPAPVALDLKEASGTITTQGSDWMNLLVFMQDEAGNQGFAKESVYVREKPVTVSETHEASFVAAVEGLEDPDVYPHTFEWKGALKLDLELDDPSEAVNQVEVSVREKEAEEDLYTTDATGNGNFSLDIDTTIPRDYEVTVVPVQGAAIGYSLRVTFEYDYTPPELVRLPCPEPHYSLGHCG